MASSTSKQEINNLSINEYEQIKNIDSGSGGFSMSGSIFDGVDFSHVNSMFAPKRGFQFNA